MSRSPRKRPRRPERSLPVTGMQANPFISNTRRGGPNSARIDPSTTRSSRGCAVYQRVRTIFRGPSELSPRGRSSSPPDSRRRQRRLSDALRVPSMPRTLPEDEGHAESVVPTPQESACGMPHTRINRSKENSTSAHDPPASTHLHLLPGDLSAHRRSRADRSRWTLGSESTFATPDRACLLGSDHT